MGWRDSGGIEIDSAPRYAIGQKVRARKYVKNDGTFPRKEIGEVLVKKGDAGYVASIGTFLQQYYVYAVDFYERGHLVGMLARELEPLEGEGVCEP